MKVKKIISFLLLAFFATALSAQPAAVKNVAKSVFTLTTFRADGTFLGSSHGVFISTNGEAISDLKPFLGAASAVVIDQKGTRMNVTRMLGISDAYDVARFKVEGKTTPAQLASAQSQGTSSWLVGYSTKNPDVYPATVKTLETFDGQYAYYIFNMNAPDNALACPFVNANGEVMGLMRVSTTSFDTYAVDARYVHNLTLSALSYNDPSIRQISIPLAMPTDPQQAQLSLMMAQQSGDSIKYDAAVRDFMSLFPTNVEGYEAMARIHYVANRFAEADQTMEEALKKAEQKDEAHYQYSRIIYDKAIYKPNAEFPKWTLDKALEEVNTALTLNPIPLYQHHQAQILFSKGQFQEALNLFDNLYKNKDFANPELLFEQAQCKKMLQAPSKEIIQLLDSAINTTDTLRFAEAAPYFLARAEAYLQTDSFRQAVFDYTRYEILMQGRVTSEFYYMRSQAEVKGRLYQQALADMGRAIILSPKEPVYYAEMAQQQLRVGQTDQALQFAQKCTEIAPEYPEGWLLLGLSQIRKEMKTEALNSFGKAKELGSEQADSLIEKYK
ncbi:MAG: hypothetical protein K5893_07380 [Prevotella sp.]|nr:hypothetical protein [Prevotella sp.]